MSKLIDLHINLGKLLLPDRNLEDEIEINILDLSIEGIWQARHYLVAYFYVAILGHFR